MSSRLLSVVAEVVSASPIYFSSSSFIEESPFILGDGKLLN